MNENHPVVKFAAAVVILCIVAAIVALTANFVLWVFDV